MSTPAFRDRTSSLKPVKRALLNTVRHLGLFAPFRLVNKQSGVIVMYHRFTEDGNREHVSRSEFATHLQYLCSHYRLVSIPAMVAELSSGNRSERAMAAITIDDGYADSYDVAYPLLRRFGVPATLFVVTDFLDLREWLWTDRVRYAFHHTRTRDATVDVGSQVVRFDLDHEYGRSHAAMLVTQQLKHLAEEDKRQVLDRLAQALRIDVPTRPPADSQPITWDQAREMDRHGVAVEPHTVTHPILTNVSSDQLRHEVSASRARVEDELGRRANIFCYPNGDWNPNVRSEVERAGYAYAVTTTVGLNEPGVDPFCLKRLGGEGDLGRFAKTTSGFELWQTSVARAIGARL